MGFEQAPDERVSSSVDPLDHVGRFLIVAGPGTGRSVSPNLVAI